ncbi:MAG TPA: hypothetical protein V6C72_02885 [Chroococcales cyanobacterium]
MSAEKITRLRKNCGMAKRMARYHWLDKAAAANPLIVQSICNFHSAAAILAKHPRLGDIAEQDHYLCRRLTRWKDVARTLAQNPQAERVVSLDPQGTYTAVKHDKKFGKALAKNPMFDQMIDENPELAKVFAQYM